LVGSRDEEDKDDFFFVCCFVCACLNFKCGFYVLVFFLPNKRKRISLDQKKNKK
jgi:hypothetical protein